MNYLNIAIGSFKKDNNLSSNETFRVLNKDGKYLYSCKISSSDKEENAYVFTFDDYDDYFSSDFDKLSEFRKELLNILIGVYIIEKNSYVPRYGEAYYCVSCVYGENGHDAQIWRNNSFDFMCLETGNCYRTQKEAMENINKHIKKWKNLYEKMSE